MAASADTIAHKLAGLPDLSRDALAERWTVQFGCPPPPGVRRELLLYAAAFHLQAKGGGGMAPDAKRALKRAVAEVARKMEKGRAAAFALPSSSLSVPIVLPPPERRGVSPGARLLRDWNGTTHVVDVVEGGFLYGGEQHRSLSAIAKLITGAHWSGPRFFGL